MNGADSSVVVVIPTYREHDNIQALILHLLANIPAARIVVVDDGSDDGTCQTLHRLQAAGLPVVALQRRRKLGLGTAYVLGMSLAREQAGWVVQMDADLSHDPADVGRLVQACRLHDVSIGSRYVQGGGSEHWPWGRRLLSRSANWLVGQVLKLPVIDATGGFRCMRASLLKRLPLAEITSAGFAFQWDFNSLAARHGATFAEVPIRFHRRAAGRSKMSIRIMLEGLWRLSQLRARRGA